MKKIYSYLCQHDNFTIGLISILMAGCWVLHFMAFSEVTFLSLFGVVTLLWTILFFGSILNWSSNTTISDNLKVTDK
jgi:hypothetical protein